MHAQIVVSIQTLRHALAPTLVLELIGDINER